jgi:hypothetical protein
MHDQDQFDKWVAMWDKVRAEFDADEKKEPVETKNSYFGMHHGYPADEPVSETEQKMITESSHWRDVYYRAQQISTPFTEENENFGAKGPGPDNKKFTQNPVHFASHGQDASPSPYDPVRVTPNFTDGKELVELNDLKVKLEKLESSLLAADIKSGSGTPDWMSQLDKLRKQIDGLSDRLTPNPVEDVT